MSVSRFILPSNAVDGDLAVLARIGAAFAPHAGEPASMAIVLDAGHVRAGPSLIETTKQLVGPFTAPASNPRIDRVVVNAATGVVSVLPGTPAASPVPPAIPASFIPVAQVLLVPGTLAITDEMIVDERDFSVSGTGVGSLLNVRRFAASGTYTPTPGTTSVIVDALGGGGGGGGCAATSSGQMSAGGGGGAGSYGRGRFTSDFSGVTVTVAAGVAASASGGAGAAGNTSSFGSLLIAPGGAAGTVGDAVSTPAITWGSNASTPPTGNNIAGGSGEGGGLGLALHPTSAAGGRGGATLFGAGSSGSLNGNTGSGNSSLPYGSGGGGACNLANMPARSGGAGAAGLVIVYEFA
ncbi:hypothetical protein Q9Q95_14395 [Sphingomonas sp. DG1-23]|uniref:glycine-rich domain-containing protein n=1 Tax=Sphingomonas sp. DG1-23 TaxID=3068316 RepID=UPI00273E2AB3|nr:hypothetical protein [Sphingomonas sp. DG1-23]MDP5280116.1 hypothetical protein [Sphingomonas sp. DG1-23]